MKTCDQPQDLVPEPEICLTQSSGAINTTAELTLRQKIMTVLIAVVSSFAVGSIPVVYAFTVAPTHNQTTTQTPIPHGEMF